MRFTKTLVFGVAFAIALGGCGGGGAGSQPGPAAMLAQTPPNSVIRVGSAAATAALPALPGIEATMAFADGDAPDGTVMTVATSLSAPPGTVASTSSQRQTQQRGSIAVLFYATFQLPFDVTLTHIPAFSVALANPPSPNQQYFYAVSDPTTPHALTGFRTEGPATVSGSTIAFARTRTGLTLHAHVIYVFAFYGVDSGQQRVLATWPTTFRLGVPVAPALFTLKIQVDPAGTSLQNTILPCLTVPGCGDIITQPFPPPSGSLLNNLSGGTAKIDSGAPTFPAAAQLLTDPGTIISSCLHQVGNAPFIGCDATTSTTLQQASFPRLGGMTIDRIDTRYDSVVIQSPGSDPNHDGKWTDLNAAITLLIYGHPQ